MYKIGDVRMETCIKNGKVQNVTYGICTAVHNNTNPQLCGATWRTYSANNAPVEVRSAVTIRTYCFV